tara:strand:+ start:410 stop:1195 length:786 start_codon:yes stop_codon:yes gene_type:complete
LIKAKKSLGQNFLIDKKILDLIANITTINGRTILEVGPGTGNLTSLILKNKPKKLYVVEKDSNLSENLKLKFKDKLTIINEDILETNEKSLSKEKIKVFGNLPYNISTEILCKWIRNLDNNFWFDELVLMFQKEVAERIIAKYNTSHYGRLTILSNWKLEIKKICDVKPESFYPKPKVDSSILLFKPKKNYFIINNVKYLEHVTRVLFNHRRKMLKKSFNQLFNGDQKILQKLNIDLKLRPQNLKFETYYELAREYEILRN